MYWCIYIYMYWYINMYWYIYMCVCTGIYRYIYVCMYTMCYLGATASRLNAICSFRVPQGPNLQHFRPTTSQLNTLNQSTSVLLPNYRSSTYLLYTPTYYLRCGITTCILSTLQTTYHQPR